MRITEEELDAAEQKAIDAMGALQSVRIKLQLQITRVDSQLRAFRETVEFVAAARGEVLQKSAELDGAVIGPAPPVPDPGHTP